MGTAASKSSDGRYSDSQQPCFSFFCPPSQLSKKTSDILGSPMPATPLDRLRQRKSVMEEAMSHPVFLSRYGGLEKNRSDEWNIPDFIPPPPSNGTHSYGEQQPPKPLQAEIHESEVSTTKTDHT
jgi:hypothetical protein